MRKEQLETKDWITNVAFWEDVFLLVLFFSVSTCIAANVRRETNNEFEKIWKELLYRLFEGPSRQYFGGTKRRFEKNPLGMPGANIICY